MQTSEAIPTQQSTYLGTQATHGCRHAGSCTKVFRIVYKSHQENSCTLPGYVVLKGARSSDTHPASCWSISPSQTIASPA